MAPKRRASTKNGPTLAQRRASNASKQAVEAVAAEEPIARPDPPVTRHRRNSLFGPSDPEPEEAPPPSPRTWIMDAEEKLQYCKEDRIRFLAARHFLKHAPQLTGHTQYFAGTLALAANNDSSVNVRKVATDALGALGRSACAYADTLERILLKDKHEQVRMSAAAALAAIGKDRGIFPQTDALRKAILHDSQLAVRCEAARALALFDMAASVEFAALGCIVSEGLVCHRADRHYLDHCDHRGTHLGSDSVLRLRAVAAFAFFGEKAGPYAEILAEAALSDAAVGVRLAAADSVRLLNDVAKPGVLQLAAALEDEDPLRRKAAARALSAIGYVEPRPPTPEETEDVSHAISAYKKKKKNKKEEGKSPSKGKASPKRKGTIRNIQVEAPPPPPTPPPLKTAGITLASLALTDPDALVRYQAGKALASFGRAVSPQVRAMAQTALGDDDAVVRSRASEALGALGPSEDWRAEHAQTFSELIGSFNGSPGRPQSRCGTADIIAQNRAVAALRDLGTAARPHRGTLDSIRQDGRDPGVRMAAHRALGAIGSQPSAASGGRMISTPLSMVDLHRTLASLRSDTAALSLEARCSTAAGQRSEDMLFLRAKMLA